MITKRNATYIVTGTLFAVDLGSGIVKKVHDWMVEKEKHQYGTAMHVGAGNMYANVGDKKDAAIIARRLLELKELMLQPR